MEIILNGKKIDAPEGLTILEVARREGIDIPTLCHDEELNPFGSCWVCAVQVEGRRGFVTSCGTKISPGMVITTDSEEIHKARRMALELLISDHYADCEAPCKLACPDNVDVQTYVSLIANGKYHEAVKVIKDTLPMPLSIGRVCPAFCEVECRRQIVDEPIAIRQLKRYAADEDLGDYWQYTPERKPDKGKKVAIIGGGPSGLTCGYYLSFEGYEVDLFEAEEACGGWLRYGIPEYRLPKAILDEEIALMCLGGMKIHTGKALGKDLNLQELSANYDAVYLAIGAQNAVPMPVEGSDLGGCYLGVDFLKAHAKGKTPKIGNKVAIVGGGNTAIDCARTCIRLGAEVSLIYRRTKGEMPAESFEIEAAEHEGVKFYFLANPVQYIGEHCALKEIKIEKMRLGDPDSSGRRRPEPTGEYFTEKFDSIIAAISQVPEISMFIQPENKIMGDVLPISRWQTAIVDEKTMYSGMANIFAGGDFQRGAATAIEAIADGRKAAEAIDNYLQTGELPKVKYIFDSKKAKRVQDVSPAEYEIYERIARVKMPEIPISEACTSFTEVEKGFSEEEARKEAARCIECGCQVNESCSLRNFCSEYEVAFQNFLGAINRHPIDHSHPYILRDANKCINCGRCIRTCAEIQGPNALGFIYRGFTAYVGPEFGESLTQTGCVACGKCIDVCPVGALVERNLDYKLNPLGKEKVLQNCGLCGVGCDIQVELQAGKTVLITTPQEKPGFNGKNLCFKGRYGWQAESEKLQTPLILKQGEYHPVSWHEALQLLKGIIGPESSIGVEITPHITLEELLLAQRVAEGVKSPLYSKSTYLSFSDKYLELKPNPNAFALLEDYQEYVVVGRLNRALLSLIRLEQRKGKKLIVTLYPESDPFYRFPDEKYMSLEELSYKEDRLFVYSQTRISESVAAEIWNINKGRNILHTSDYMNHRGFLALNPQLISTTKADLVLGFGNIPAQRADFKVAICAYMPEGKEADLILPGNSFLDIEGVALGDNAKLSRFENPNKSVAFGELTRLLYSLGLIPASLADIPYWNYQAEELLKQLESYQPEAFEPVALDKLRKHVVISDCPHQAIMQALYDARKTPTNRI